MSDRYVMVTTKHRGVFMGRANGDVSGRTVELEECQMCVYWASGGVLGLAKDGPSTDCRITAPAPKAIIHDVTAVFDVADDGFHREIIGPKRKMRQANSKPYRRDVRERIRLLRGDSGEETAGRWFRPSPKRRRRVSGRL